MSERVLCQNDCHTHHARPDLANILRAGVSIALDAGLQHTYRIIDAVGGARQTGKNTANDMVPFSSHRRLHQHTESVEEIGRDPKGALEKLPDILSHVLPEFLGKFFLSFR